MAWRRSVDDRLAQCNEEQAGYRDWRDLAALVTDESDGMRSGLLGRTSLALLFVDPFYLPQRRREQRNRSFRVTSPVTLCSVSRLWLASP